MFCIHSVINVVAKLPDEKECLFLQSLVDTKFCISISVFRAGIAAPLDLHWSTFLSTSKQNNSRKIQGDLTGLSCLVQTFILLMTC